MTEIKQFNHSIPVNNLTVSCKCKVCAVISVWMLAAYHWSMVSLKSKLQAKVSRYNNTYFNRQPSFITMKCILLSISIVFLVSSCQANNVVCQLFSEQMKLLEKYCENYTAKVPKVCVNREIEAVDAIQVEHLNIGGCDSVTVLDCIKTFRNVRALDISYSNYTTLDWLDLDVERLEAFNASHNEFNSIKMSQHNISGLTEIDLSYNHLKRIDSYSFRGAGKLVKIHLSHNTISSIHANSFVNSTHLTYIDLSHNHFWSVPIFPHNKMLRALHLENNPILTFSCSEVTTLSLASLYFPWNSAISFHGDGMCEQKPLHVIRDYRMDGVLVSNEQTHEIHCSEQSFLNLTIFIAGHNSFANVGDLLQCFGPSVMHMDLSNNFIGILNTAVLERFDGLTALSLSNTMLIDFDCSMLQSKRLMKLDVSNNNLKRVRNAQFLENLEMLEELYIGGNQVENLAEIIQHLKPSIEKLDLFGNYMGPLNMTVFQHLTALRVLNLSSTLLSISDFTAFETLKNLSILDISRNDLKDVNFTMLSNLEHLIKLNAAYCYIENIAQIIGNLKPTVKVLDLSGNSVGILNADFEALINLEFLNLSNANIVNFDFSTLEHQRNLLVLDISFNKLQEVNFALSTKRIVDLNLAENQLSNVKNLNRTQFSELRSLALSKNQLSCNFLKRFISEWNDLIFIGNPFEQKHGKNCNSKIQYISDFFNSTYYSVKFW